MAREKAKAWHGMACPANPTHGSTVGITMPDETTAWHCPHFDHEPTPKTAIGGARPATRNIFTLDEVESGVAA